MLHSNRLQNVICVGVAQCDTEERIHLKLFYKKYYCICHFLCGPTIGLYYDRWLLTLEYVGFANIKIFTADYLDFENVLFIV